MKKLLFAMLILLPASGCKESIQKRAERLVREELEQTLHDFSSYESVKFGTLDSVMTDVSDMEEYRNTMDSARMYIDQAKKSYSDAERYLEYGLNSKAKLETELAGLYREMARVYIDSAEKIEAEFVPEFDGWSIKHSFRANNASGNKVIGHYRYYFNKEVTEVLKSKDIGENSKEE